ncbi:MAG: hypothetical protein ACRD1R_06685 [Acidobacteriota bacterium]
MSAQEACAKASAVTENHKKLSVFERTFRAEGQEFKGMEILHRRA